MIDSIEGTSPRVSKGAEPLARVADFKKSPINTARQAATLFDYDNDGDLDLAQITDAAL